MKQVIVVGAGVAGLAAAREAAKQGFQPVVLEARERCGGRILTLHDPSSPVPLELGAEFVHGLDAGLHDLLRECGATVVEQEGEHLGSGDWEEMGKVFDAMAAAPEQSFGEFIGTVEVSESAKQSAIGYVEGFNAAFKENVSVDWLNLQDDDDTGFRVREGYDAVPNYLARGLDIRYSTPVRRIRWKTAEVVAETDSGEFHAPHAIVAVPFAVLARGALAIEPEPQVLTRARDGIGIGQAIRVTLRFREAVWAGHPRLSFLHGDASFPVWWTQYPIEAPVITGWAAGPRALALRGMSGAELIRTARESLATVLNEDPGEPVAAYFHDWEQDPWARAAYSYIRVHGIEAARALALPLEGTLCFAGEAVAESAAVGTVHGALASGIAAARALFK
jgi:monoamine oxidase